MTHIAPLALALTLALSTAPVSAATLSQEQSADGAEAAFENLLDRHWALRLKEDPVFAEELGVDEARGKLSDPSLDAYERSIEARRRLLDELRAIDRDELPEEAQLNHRLLERELSSDVESASDGGEFLTINTYSSPHSGLARLAERTRLRDEEDVASYIARLEAIPAFIEAEIERLEAGIEAGWTQPCEAMVGFESTYRTHIVEDTEASVFMLPFEGATAADRGDQRRARRLIRRQVVPAFVRFGEFYEEDYVPACREKAGVVDLPGAERFYANRVASYTTTDMTADEVHRIGLDEVARIRAEMTAIAETEGYDTLAAYQDYLRTNPDLYPKTAAERIAAASTIAKRMDGKLVELFTVLPRMPYDIRPIPLDIAEGTTTAYYSQPAADGTRPGTYWLNTTRLSTRPLYELEALTLHEAVPGHHLQIALSQELDLPEFRRFGGFTAFTEGWGLYSERLGIEAGFYQTPETNFGRLSYEMWRACRLVVDTGLHAKGWSRQQAIDFMLENTGLSRNNIEREVDRYITWPGQALAYKIGELKIRELRERAEEELGEDFDLRLFHDAVLANGAVPLDVLEEEIERFIAKSQAD
jgi:uncharacterized protein (DUF885 family)